MTQTASRERFAGKVALVTGAGSGIGRAAALRLALEGAVVVCADVNETAAQATAAEAGPSAAAVRLDVTEESNWEAALGGLLASRGRLDLLIHCAGVSAGAPLAEMPFSEWRRALSINLDGAFLGAKHALRAMRSGSGSSGSGSSGSGSSGSGSGSGSGGSIVFVASASGVRAAAGAAAYSASKAGLCMLAKTAAKECRDQGLGIRVNTVCPGGVKTPMWSGMPFFRDLVRQTGSEDAAFAALAAGPAGPFAEPADVVAAILFLASDEARFITGVDLLADGGYVL